MEQSSVLKIKKLQQFKMFALLLLLGMAVIYTIATVFLGQYPWLGYVQAFAEAAMVGALADWFAVTALFHYPLGIRIPHTNLIENSKQSIGNNLGDFVVQNFITPDVIRPRLEQFSVAERLSVWLQKESNQDIITQEMIILLDDILTRINKQDLVPVVSKQAELLISRIDMSSPLAAILDHIVSEHKYEPLLDAGLLRLKEWVITNETMIRDMVKKESSVLVPGFVDNIIAKKITNGFIHLLDNVRNDHNHSIRRDLETQLKTIIIAVRSDSAVKEQLEEIKHQFLSGQAVADMAAIAVDKILEAMLHDLKQPDAGIRRFINGTLASVALQLAQDGVKGQRIDQWIRFHAFRIIMNNREQVGRLISNTVGNWNGADLSGKLELEVGKDLQFIRINGTIVGGLVGLLIYIITRLIHHF